MVTITCSAGCLIPYIIVLVIGCGDYLWEVAIIMSEKPAISLWLLCGLWILQKSFGFARGRGVLTRRWEALVCVERML